MLGQNWMLKFCNTNKIFGNESYKYSIEHMIFKEWSQHCFLTATE